MIVTHVKRVVDLHVTRMYQVGKTCVAFTFHVSCTVVTISNGINMYDRIWERGPFSEFPNYINAYITGTIAAMDLNIGILPSFWFWWC